MLFSLNWSAVRTVVERFYNDPWLDRCFGTHEGSFVAYLGPARN